MTKKKTTMSEEQLRDYFEKNRDDQTLWSDSPAAAKIGKQSSIVFSIRFTADELKTVKDQAAAWGMTISGYIRKAILKWSADRRYDVSYVPQSTIRLQATPLTRASGGLDWEPANETSSGH